ncbi:MAG: cytochrome P450 [Ignavibacteria bacterium]|nr:cytochrome P450 [Ignavibacteria bacterium]
MNRPPGPSKGELIRSVPGLLRDPLGIFLDWKDRYGTVVSVPVRTPPTLHLSDPADLRHILVSHPERYRKTGALIIGRRLIGKGLLASGEPLHSQQRRIAQPHFTRQAVDQFARMMITTTEEMLSQWQTGTVVDIFPQMARLTIAIIGKAYFTNDFTAIADQLYKDFGVCQRYMQKLVYLPESFPTPGNIRYRRAVARIDRVIRRLIRERQAQERDRPDDLLTTLIEARDDAGNALSENQVRDEMVNILLAGHETTAIALSWTWYFLSLHPSVERTFHQEISGVRLRGHEDLGALGYTEMVLNESMRIRPPVWIIARVALETDRLESGLVIPEGTEVLMLPYVVHRNAAWFPNPELFDPSRFAPNDRKRPPLLYFPFGAGPRGCIGEAFARMEALIILTLIGGRFSLRLTPGQNIVPDPLVTLRPKRGILMTIEERPPIGNKQGAGKPAGVGVPG